jgi:hypothetical protein
VRNRDWLGVAAAAWFIGLCALLCDHFRPSLPLVIGVRALFVAATSCAICWALVDKARVLAGTSQEELYGFSRLVSRWVYILMYVLAMARLALCLYEQAQGPAKPVRPLEDFQFYVATCVASLWLIRGVVLALRFTGRSASSGKYSSAYTLGQARGSAQ